MDLRAQVLRKSRDVRWIVSSLAALMVVAAALFYLLQRGRDLPAELVRNRILVFVLVYINAVLVLVVLFVLLRNVLKLVLERRNRILGSKFKTRLVAAYMGLSLLPVLLLFLYGSQLLQGWIDRWFDEPAIQRVLAQGYAVAQALDRRVEAIHDLAADSVGREVRELALTDPLASPLLARRLEALQLEWGLDCLAVYQGEAFVHGVVSPRSGLVDLPEADRRFLREARARGRAVRFVEPRGVAGRLVLSAAATPGGELLVVVGTLLDPVLSAQTADLIEAHQGYLQLAVQKGDIEASYLLLYLMVTLLILLAFSWVGLTLARRVTVPIQALAEGTRRISGGDLDHRVEVEADDELGVLVSSFNRMTAELKRNKEELVAANRRLEEERALIAAVLETMAAGVISTDAEGRVLIGNRAALAMLRQGEAAVVGRPLAEAWADPERGRLARLFVEAAAGGGRDTRQLRLVLDGETKTFEAKLETMRDRTGRLTGRVLVLEDLSELIQAQRLAAWSEAARRIAHEIKNPLTPIRLSAERLRVKSRQGDAQLPQAVEEAVAIIGREVEEMKAMVDEFSRFARMPPPQPRPVDVPRLVGDTVHLYEGIKPGVEVATAVAGEARVAVLDAEQIKRVLINLLDNAIEATAAPGAVAVEVEGRDGWLEIRVRDTGRGIPPAAREKLFLPHFSTKGRGTGLGLAIVRRIVADHAGTIRVEDNRPRGTVFVIELPQG